MRELETHAPLLLYYTYSWNVRPAPFPCKFLLFPPVWKAEFGLPHLERKNESQEHYPSHEHAGTLSCHGEHDPICRDTPNMQKLSDSGPEVTALHPPPRHWTMPQARPGLASHQGHHDLIGPKEELSCRVEVEVPGWAGVPGWRQQRADLGDRTKGPLERKKGTIEEYK